MNRKLFTAFARLARAKDNLDRVARAVQKDCPHAYIFQADSYHPYYGIGSKIKICQNCRLEAQGRGDFGPLSKAKWLNIDEVTKEDIYEYRLPSGVGSEIIYGKY